MGFLENRNAFSIILSHMPQEPEKLNNTCVTSWRREAGTPEVCLGNLLGDHLQVVERMALRKTLATEQFKGVVVGLGLFPPESLIAIHFRSEWRRPTTNCREVQVPSS